MIDEKVLIDELNTWEKGFYLPISFERLVEKQPKVGEWIPIGQFPSEPCLLCFESGHMVVGYYDFEDDEWRVLTSNGFETNLTEDDLEDGEPIACMSLPEPYKGE
jgi:hypothetical protein